MADVYSDADFETVVQQNRQIILDGVFGTATPIQVGSSMAFAKYLSHVGITAKNYLLFLKVVETNNRWVVDELVGERDPRLFFSIVRPNTGFIRRAFELLSAWHPGQIYLKVLLTVLGIIEYSFHKPDDGFRIYRLSITDLHNLGKFLDPELDQMDQTNAAVLAFLDRITQLGEYDGSLEKSTISKHAFNIRDAFFDNTKKLIDTIPAVLLVRLDREEREVAPSPEYLDIAAKIDARNRSKRSKG